MFTLHTCLQLIPPIMPNFVAHLQAQQAADDKAAIIRVIILHSYSAPPSCASGRLCI